MSYLEAFKPDNPLGTLKLQGFAFRKKRKSLGSGEFSVLMVCTLPVDALIQASFGRETLKHKFIKLFKSEIQIGDAAFDDLVYISTDTAPFTEMFLESEDVRRAIAAVVAGGGTISIEGNTVSYETVAESLQAAEPDLTQLGLFLCNVADFKLDAAPDEGVDDASQADDQPAPTDDEPAPAQ